MNENIIQSTHDVEIIKNSQIEELKRLAMASDKRRSRILLHKSRDSHVQEMLLCVHRDSYVRPHKHPAGKSESYHIVEGILRVNIYDENGRVRDHFYLGGSEGNFMHRIEGNIYHEPVSVTEFSVYHECYAGPFEKDGDVFYAPWANEEK